MIVILKKYFFLNSVLTMVSFRPIPKTEFISNLMFMDSLTSMFSTFHWNSKFTEVHILDFNKS